MGTVKVLTYENPNGFHFMEEFEPYESCLHICATQSLKGSLEKRLRKARVTSAKALVDSFYPGWNNPDERFSQYAKLSDFLRKGYRRLNPNILKSFKRNKLDLLITMRNLTEIGLRPEYVLQKVQKEEEEIFCMVWKDMLPHFAQFMSEAEYRLSPKGMESVIEPYQNSNQARTIVLHGFYYISPVQHHVLTKMKEKGFNLVFLNMYSRRFPSVFSFLEENFSETYGWATDEDWIYGSDDARPNADKFASKIEGSYRQGDMEGIDTKSYEFILDFVEDINKTKITGKENMVSPSADELNERIEEFNSGLNTNKHLLSYPIGQYLFHLHSMYDEDYGDGGAYLLQGSTLMEFFSSGWLTLEGENARDYTYQLKKILPYFSGCETTEEWTRRMKDLVYFKEGLQERHEREMLEEGLGDSNHFKKVRLNQFKRFSYLSVPLKEIKLIEAFMERIIDDAAWMMDIERERSTIRDHFLKIQDLVKEAGVKENLLLEEERRLVDELEQALKVYGDDEDYHVADLADALTIYLGDGFKSPDDKRDDGSPGKVKPMEQLDGMILSGSRSVHICAFDEKSYPMKSAPMPWPLSKKTIAALDTQATDMYLFREKHQVSISRYLFFLALSSEKTLKLSWIKNWNDQEDLAQNVYMDLLNLEVANHSDTPQEFNPVDIDYDFDLLGGQTSNVVQYPSEEMAEASLCARRVYYSSVLQTHSSYQNDFHQSFLIGNLVKQAGASGKDKGVILSWMKGMFPHFSEVRLKSIIESNSSKKLLESQRHFGKQKRDYDGFKYDTAITYFQFLTHRGGFTQEKWKESMTYLGEDPVKSYKKLKLEDKFDADSMPEASPSALCKYCPHSYHCEASIFHADMRGQEEEV
ncbi:hypothetical protein ACJA3J_12350 [Halobacillus sp. SY10]|uniref:hypothetical protein n=1 Tax=Halobacillus sp. SY10 TaxID=3381356 RepID=UPI00387A040C